MQLPTDLALDRLDLDLLDDREHRRLESFTAPADRIRYAAAHILLRRTLGELLAVPPDGLRFTADPCPGCGGGHGRPRLDGVDRAPEFSLSHSGALVLIGVAPVPLGVDVEAVPREDAARRLAAALHPAEQDEVAALPAAHRPLAVARIWTRKEAFLKGTGTGLNRDPALDYVGLGPRTRLPGPAGWSFARIPVAVGYAAALAVRGDGPAPTARPEQVGLEQLLREDA